MRLLQSRIVLELPPGADNPRNSEGDFLRLRDGRIVYVYSRYTGDDREDDCPCDLAAVFSDNGGRSFGSPRILVHAADHGVRNVMSVSFLRMQNGDAGLFYLVKDDKTGASRYVLRRSADDLATLQPPVQCLPQSETGFYYVVNNCRVLRTTDGRILIPAAEHRVGQDGAEYYARSVFYVSADDGRTFRPCGGAVSCPVDSETGLQEPGLLELSGGALYAHFRTDLYCQYECVSRDGGAHWTQPQPSGFSSPESPMKLSRNPFGGKVYALWNPVPEYVGRNADPPGEWITAGRTPLLMAESRDGVRFGEPVVLEDDPGRGFCYPAVFFLNAHEMLLAYCSGGREDGACLCRTTIRHITVE